MLALLPFDLYSLLFVVFLFDVFLFPLCLLARFSFLFLCLVLLLFLRLLPLVPFLGLLRLFFPLLYTWRLPCLLPCLRPFSLPHSLFLLHLFFPLPFSFSCSFCFFLLLFLSLMYPLSASEAFRPPLGFPPLPCPPGFRSSYSSGFSSSSLFLFSLGFCHPVVLFGSSSCLSLLFGRLACICSLIFFLFPFLLFSCGFRFVFGFRCGFVSFFFVSGALVLSVGGFSFHTCLSALLSSPLHLMPLVLSPLPLISSPPLFVRLPLLCLPLLRWLLSPPLALRLLSFGSSFLMLPLLSL